MGFQAPPPPPRQVFKRPKPGRGLDAMLFTETAHFVVNFLLSR